MQQFHANGKLLLTGEYTVLDGALALAVPTRQGQNLMVEEDETSDALHWTSYDHQGNVWLALSWMPPLSKHLKIQHGDEKLAERLLTTLQAAITLSGGDFSVLAGKRVTTRLDFDRHWGLGSSSTLIHCLASWLDVDAFALLEATFGGSGYDLACAAAKGPILFQRKNGQPLWEEINWKPDWLGKTYFLYLNKKQNSREGIAHYRQQAIRDEDIAAISYNTAQLLGTRLLRTAKNISLPTPSMPTIPTEMASMQKATAILAKHEATTARLTQQTSIQAALFPDFPGQIKSLGAWGGDFAWVLSEWEEAHCRHYFQKRGYEVLLPWRELINWPNTSSFTVG